MPKLQEKPSALKKRTSSTSKHENSVPVLFFIFVGHFCPPGSGSIKLMRIHADPQPCLAHDESAEDLVEAVAVLRLADDEILQLGVLEPYRVGRLHPGFEGHGLGSYKRDGNLAGHRAINQGRGSGSDPYSIGSVDPDPYSNSGSGSRRAK